MKHKTCYMCEHIFMQCATTDYSEYTPGSDFELYCYRNHWELDTYKDQESDLARYLETANTCKDFSKASYVQDADESEDTK